MSAFGKVKYSNGVYPGGYIIFVWHIKFSWLSVFFNSNEWILPKWCAVANCNGYSSTLSSIITIHLHGFVSTVGESKCRSYTYHM